MADPYRLVILKKLTAWLQGITPENDFEIDLSTRIFRGRLLFGKEHGDDPIISILEAPNADDGLFAGNNEVRSDEWRLLIQGIGKDDKDNPTDPLYPLAAAVEKRLLQIPSSYRGLTPPEGYMLDDTIAAIKVHSPIVRPANEVSSRAFFYMGITLTVVTPD